MSTEAHPLIEVCEDIVPVGYFDECDRVVVCLMTPAKIEYCMTSGFDIIYVKRS